MDTVEQLGLQASRLNANNEEEGSAEDYALWLSSLSSLLRSETSAKVHLCMLLKLQDLLKDKDGQPTRLAEEYGWEIARDIGCFILPSSEAVDQPVWTVSNVPEDNVDEVLLLCSNTAQQILKVVGESSSPRELALFSIEYLWETLRDGEEFAKMAAIIKAYSDLWVTALERRKSKKLAMELETAYLTLISTFRAASELEQSGVQYINGHLEVVERLVRLADSNNIGDDEGRHRRHALICLLLQLFAVCLGRLPNTSDSEALINRALALIPSLNIDIAEVLQSETYFPDRDLGPEILESTFPSQLGCSIMVAALIAKRKGGTQDGRTPELGIKGVDLLKAFRPHIESLLQANMGVRGLALFEIAMEDVPRETVFYADDNDDGALRGWRIFIQTIITFMVGTPDQALRPKCFALFKSFMWCFNETARFQILIEMIVDAPMANIQVAALSVLKDNVHEAWNRAGSQKVSVFSGRALRQTFLSVLLDPSGPLYTTIPTSDTIDHSSDTIFDNEESFVERFAGLMHVLNLYLYILLRDAPAANVTGVWDGDHLITTSNRFIQPLQKRINALLDVLDARTEGLGDLDEDEQQAVQVERLHLGTMGMVLSQITDRIQQGVAVGIR
ncbi:uncharacterized protein EV422DRAFT_514362 [Fimicolochytrium jonesii]|uniref:uncharacterized protein n=1 Tax=Fimicolochytrium jonesii TaxID=1396493 RepID=UPI0022FF2D2E|nr:uncharacterized protein EV422DRAFT_514362 [Fimicolochytrium jonesii]KAI8825824.1 hypothetical protein EV422DRAFT_514362 [Fimicolochytrium jonesii]